MASFIRSSASAALRRQLPAARQLPIGANKSAVLASTRVVRSTAVRCYSAHGEESFDEYNARYVFYFRLSFSLISCVSFVVSFFFLFVPTRKDVRNVLVLEQWINRFSRTGLPGDH